MRQFIPIFALSFGTCLFIAEQTDAQDQPITFIKIADTGTPVPPDDAETFSIFFAPSIDQGNVAFRARSESGVGGVYRWIDGRLVEIADQNTLLPNSDRLIEGFGALPSIDGETVMFLAANPARPEGVYTSDGGEIVVVADSFTLAPPDEDSPFLNFSGFPSRDDGLTAFIAFSEQVGNLGVYQVDAMGTITVIADLSTLIPPDRTLTFGCPTPFCNGPLAFEGVSSDRGNVAFAGGGSTSGSIEQGGIFKWVDGELTPILPPNPTIPGTDFPIRSAGTGSNLRVAISGEDVAFVAGSTTNIRAVVAQIDGELVTIAMGDDLRPGGGGAFERFNVVAIDNGSVAFSTLRSVVPTDGIYLKPPDGELIKIINRDDLLDGKEIDSFRFGPEALNGSEIAFAVDFVDGSGGVYIASLGNEKPVSDAGMDDTVSCTSPTGAMVTLDGSGSSDPDGDRLTYAWRNSFGEVSGVMPAVFLPFGSHLITLVVNDGNLDSDPDTVTITVDDTTPPGLVASLSAIAGDDDDDDDDDARRLQIKYSASDTCDPTPSLAGVLAIPGVADIPVADGQIIALKFDDETEIESEDGILEIEASGLVLKATAVDAAGNAATAEVQLARSSHDHDDDD